MHFGDDIIHMSFQIGAYNDRFRTVHRARKKHMNIHQMYGSERFILHVKTHEHPSNVRFRTVHLARKWYETPERFRTVRNGSWTIWFLAVLPKWTVQNGSWNMYIIVWSSIENERLWRFHCVSGILPHFSYDDSSSSYAASNSHQCTGFANQSNPQRTFTIIWNTINMNKP